MSVRTVITGMGVATPHGLDTTDFWAATRVGKSAIAPITRFDVSGYPARLGGEIRGFTAAEHLPGRLVPQTDRVTQLALVAAHRAFKDARLDPHDVPADDMGVVTAITSGGGAFVQDEMRRLFSRGSRHVSAYESFAWFNAVNSGQISIRHGLRGPTGVLVSEQAGGLDALAQARRRLRKGCALMAAGGFDAPIHPLGWAAQLAGGRLSTSGDPERAYLPFDAAARGHVPGEGGALLIVEREDSARARGASAPYAEIAGHAATLDPRPGSGRPPGLRRVIELALADAAADARDVDVVFADSAATALLDREEADALTAVFGPHGVPVTAPKTMIGRLQAGGSAVDVATAVLSIREGLIPPTVHVRPSPDHRLDLVTGQARTASVHTALVLARGAGGFNSALVVRALD
ncbi:ketosynthase chain-length factor [Streptomyces albidoflavus]